MRVELNFPWKRYALIVALAKAFQRTGVPLGKTALQKLVYFLESVFGVDAGYEFSLYTYGPFCVELLHDLDVAEAIGGVRVDYDATLNWYQISPGPRADWIEDRGREFLDNVASAIDEVVSDYGRSTAKELELHATVVFSHRQAQSSGSMPQDEELVDEVHEIKPHFDRHEIFRAVRQLRMLGYLT